MLDQVRRLVLLVAAFAMIGFAIGELGPAPASAGIPLECPDTACQMNEDGTAHGGGGSGCYFKTGYVCGDADGDGDCDETVTC